MELAIVTAIVSALVYVQLAGANAPAIARGVLFFVMAGALVGVISLLFSRSERASQTTCT